MLKRRIYSNSYSGVLYRVFQAIFTAASHYPNAARAGDAAGVKAVLEGGVGGCGCSSCECCGVAGTPCLQWPGAPGFERCLMWGLETPNPEHGCVTESLLVGCVTVLSCQCSAWGLGCEASPIPPSNQTPPNEYFSKNLQPWPGMAPLPQPAASDVGSGWC